MGEPSRQYKPIDLLEFKRRLQARVDTPRTSEDPLAELARIIGGEGRGLPVDSGTREEPSFAGSPRVEGRDREPLEPAFEPVHRPAADFSPNYPSVDLPSAHPADVAGDEEETWPGSEELAGYTNENFPAERPSRAYLRLRNHKRRNMSLYATSAATLVVAGILVAVFARPGVSVGVAPALRATMTAVATKPPADEIAASSAASATAPVAPATTAASANVADSAATSSAAMPANPPSVRSNDSLFARPRLVQTVPIYGDGSFLGQTNTLPGVGQISGASNGSAGQFSEAQPLQLSSPGSPTNAAESSASVGDDSATPVNGPAPVVATREPPKTAASPAARIVPTNAAAGATFAAILAAPMAESAARSMLTTLQKKYTGALAGHRLTYHRVKSASGIAYDVRAGGLANAAAKSVCDKVNQAGGSCQVGSR